MKYSELENNILKLVAMTYGKEVSQLTLETRFKEDLNAASVKMVALVSEIENELDVSLMLADASKCLTIKEMIKLVEEEM